MVTTRRLVGAVMLVLAGAVRAGAPRPAVAQAAPAVDCSRVRDGTMDHAAMDHAAHQSLRRACAPALAAAPAETGQAAFAAIAEIVRLLDADPATDWSKVDIASLRAHLRDMDDVMMRAEIRQSNTPGGLVATVTGPGRTVGAIRRMLANHAGTATREVGYRIEVRDIPQGARVVITAPDPSDLRAVARIRGLGVAGILTEGGHHQPHHLAIAHGNGAVHRH